MLTSIVSFVVVQMPKLSNSIYFIYTILKLSPYRHPVIYYGLHKLTETTHSLLYFRRDRNANWIKRRKLRLLSHRIVSLVGKEWVFRAADDVVSQHRIFIDFKMVEPFDSQKPETQLHPQSTPLTLLNPLLRDMYFTDSIAKANVI